MFHAVSAFCNAGFALRSSNLMEYRYLPGVNLTICGLIILGGLGFFSHIGLYRALRRRERLRLSVHTRLVLALTNSLIILGALGFLLLEVQNVLSGDGFLGMLLTAFFNL